MLRHCPQIPSDPTSVEWKKVAAVEEFFDIITAYHCTEDGAHLGIKKTLARVSIYPVTGTHKTCIPLPHAYQKTFFSGFFRFF